MSSRAPRRALHVYGVIDAAAHALPRLSGRQGAAVRRVRHDKVVLLVSDLDSALRLTREDLLAHAHVLEKIAEHHSVVPMRFGVQAESDTQLRDRVSAFHGHWVELLRRFKGLVQLTVEARHAEDEAIREVLRRDPVAVQLSRRLPEANDVRGQGLRVRLGERVADGLARLREDDRSELMGRLSPAARSVRTRDAADCVLSAAFLAERERRHEFDKAVTRVKAAYPRVELRYVGPQPPWAFLDESAGPEATWAY